MTKLEVLELLKQILTKTNVDPNFSALRTEINRLIEEEEVNERRVYDSSFDYLKIRIPRPDGKP